MDRSAIASPGVIQDYFHIFIWGGGGGGGGEREQPFEHMGMLSTVISRNQDLKTNSMSVLRGYLMTSEVTDLKLVMRL